MIKDAQIAEVPSERIKRFISRCVNWRRLTTPIAIILSLFIGFTLFAFPSKLALAAAALVTGLMLTLVIIRNPFVGMFAYILCEYGRPQDQFPALASLHISKFVLIILAIAWVLRLISERKSDIVWNAQSWAFSGFLFVMGLTVVTAVNNHWAFQYFRGMFITFLGYFLFISLIDSMPRFQKFFWLFLLTHAFLAVKGIHRYATGYQTAGFAAGSFIGDENDFAMVLNNVIPYAYFSFFGAKSSIQRVGSLLLFFLFIIAVVLSFSRGGFVGLIPVLGYCLLRSPRRGLATAMAVGSILSMILVAPTGYWDEVRSIKDAHNEEDTGKVRIESWKAAIRMFIDYPIIGVGAGNFPIRFEEYQSSWFGDLSMWGRATHGTYPQVLAELGLAGTFFFIWMIYLNFRDIWQIKKMTKVQRDLPYYMAEGITVSMIGYLISAIFLSTLYYPHLWMLSAITVSLRNAVMKDAANTTQDVRNLTYVEGKAVTSSV